jgi:flagella basal body P-ring formation protein FlgA
VVAAHDISPGHRLTAGDLTIREFRCDHRVGRPR